MRISPFCLLLVLITTNATAQWQQLQGPQGGSIYSLYQYDSIVYSTTKGGVYYTSDFGNRWVYKRQLHPSDLSYNRVPLFKHDNIILVDVKVHSGSNGHYLYRSENGGETYEEIIDSSQEHSIARIGDELYLARSFSAAMSDKRSLLKSLDFGKTWQDITPLGLCFFQIKTDGRCLYSIGMDITSRRQQIYRSLDRGATWDTLRGGPVDSMGLLIGPDIFEVGIEGADTIWCISYSAYVDSLNMPSVFFILNQEDSLKDAHFPEQNSRYGRDYIVRSMGVSGGRLYAASRGRMFEYEHQQWKDITYNLREFCFEVDIRGFWAGSVGSPKRLLIIVDSYGSLVSLDAEKGKYTRSDSGLIASHVRGLLSYKDTLYAVVYAGSENLYYSTDNGKTWLGSGYKPNEICDIRAMAATSAGLMLGDQHWISIHRGASKWSSDSIWGQILAFEIMQDTFYCRTGSGYYRSTNLGASWQRIISSSWEYGVSVCVSGILFNGSQNLRMSTDGAETWQVVPANYAAAWRAMATDGINLYAGVTTGNGKMVVIKSIDLGLHWEEISPMYDDDTLPLKIYIYDKSLFMATSKGLFVCDLNGTGARFIPVGNTQGYITDVTVADGYIYVGSDGFGIWMAPLKYISELLHVSNSTPGFRQKTFMSPNPVRNITTVRSSLDFKEIKIVDVLGRSVYQGDQGDGLVLAYLKPGVYFVCLFDENNSVLDVASFIKD